MTMMSASFRAAFAWVVSGSRGPPAGTKPATFCYRQLSKDVLWYEGFVGVERTALEEMCERSAATPGVLTTS